MIVLMVGPPFADLPLGDRDLPRRDTSIERMSIIWITKASSNPAY